MRILFFVHTLGRTRHFKRVIAGLIEQQHTVILATTGDTDPQKAGTGSYASPRIAIVTCPDVRGDEWRAPAESLRLFRDRLRYFDPRYAGAAKLAERAIAHTPKRWSRILERQPWLRRHWRTVQRLLAWTEALIPCDAGFLRFIQAQRPDVVLVTPLVEFGSYQTDYIKCAHQLGVPVAYAPFSWDNLTNRGLIRVMPDRVLAWNRHQRREAIDLHGVPAGRIVVTGAPRFDDFFAMTVSMRRDEFCGALGFDPEKPLLLYICSSGFIAPYEVDFVRRWIDELRRTPAGNWLRDCHVLVRPHPANDEQWRAADLSDLPGVAVWKERLSMNADRRLFDSLFHSTAVVGLNTSAMIEAAIVGRPVFTISAPEFRGGQSGTLHFHYLLAANGGVVSLAESFDQHLRQLVEAPASMLETAERSRRFLEDFVRPLGADIPASGVMVEEIQRLAAIRKRPRPSRPWHRPLRAALAGALRSAGDDNP